MQYRTDLAIEAHELSGTDIDGVTFSESENGGLRLTKLTITTDSAAERIGKPKGTYITFENLTLTDDFTNAKDKITAIAEEIRSLLPDRGEILIVGLGNALITPDAIGPKSAEYILATRHIRGELARSSGLDILRPVSVIAPGVLGQTGIEPNELIKSLINTLKPSAVIAIDALASRNLERLGCTIQICDTGISPGSGVGNHRIRLNKESLGVPVIAIGIPTVVDALTLAYDILGNRNENPTVNHTVSPRGEQMIVTPRETDILTERASKLIGMSVNCAVQAQVDYDTLMSLVS